MGFTDMLSSGRGPGFIGTLLALVVLGGFAMLYMFVFDEGLQGGGKTIEAVIRQQAKDIEKTKDELAVSTEKLAEVERRGDIELQIEDIHAAIKGKKTRIAELEAD